MWTDDLMNGPWHYGDNGIDDDVPEGVEQTLIGGHGNIISDTSGRIYRDLSTGDMVFADFPTYLHGNNHGSMEKINGQWYFNGHRQTGAHMFSRQAIMGRLGVALNEETGEPLITPMEFTSSGASESLDAYATWEAQSTTYLLASEDTPAAAAEQTNPEHIQIEEGTTPYILPTRDEEATHASYITNLTAGNIAGYKYLDFGEGASAVTFRMLVSKPDGAADGTADIWIDGPSEAQGGTLIGSVSLAAADLESAETDTATDGTVWSWAEGAMDEALQGVHAVYIVFAGESDAQICNFDQFAFERAE